jgi:hypothetical protein
MEVFVHLVRLAASAAASLMIFGMTAALADDSIGSVHSTPGERAADHWTPEAMSAAVQAPKPNVDPSSIHQPPGASRSGMNPGAMPSMVTEAATKTMHERKAGDVNSMPLVFAGKMFFSKPDGDYMCSAQFISKNVLLTAAHCVRDDKSGDFWTNITFFLQYDKGHASAKYTQSCAATFDSWVQEGADKYLSDFAMILVNDDSKTGWFGTQWDWQGAYKNATKIGYPVGISEGEVIQVLPGPISVSDGIVELRHGDPNEQGGSSGGAWIGDYDTKGDAKRNHIISVESFGFDGKPGVDYGPYFDDRVKQLFDYVSNGCQ